MDTPADSELATDGEVLPAGDPSADGDAPPGGDVPSDGDAPTGGDDLALPCSPGASGQPCDDGVFCNGADTCEAGVCVHAGDPCVGGAECADVCDEAARDCFGDEGATCTDDGNPCTDNRCDSAGACVPVNNAEACDDGLFCNGEDTCSGGACAHAGNPCRPNSVSLQYTCYEERDACAWPTFTGISVGLGHACGLSYGGELYCWGDNRAGQLGLGNGAAAVVEVPTLVSTSGIAGRKSFVAVSCGAAHTCAITSDRVTYCWGDDASGQLGDGVLLTGQRMAPSLVDMTALGGVLFSRVSAGDSHTCAVAEDGRGYCWGDDASGQLGNGGAVAETQHAPSLVDTSALAGARTWLELSAGGAHSCGLAADGVAYCWGADASGQLGNGATTSSDRASPSAVDTAAIATSRRFTRVVTSLAAHSCALAADGAAYCWGDDAAGQLGDGPTLSGARVSPSRVDASPLGASAVFTTVSAGHASTCGVASNGTAYCWGADNAGQLGDGGDSGDSVSPRPVDWYAMFGEASFASVSAGGEFACGVAAGGVAYCWGSDLYGQLGNSVSSTATKTSPEPVDHTNVYPGRRFIGVTAGELHTCGLSNEHRLYCWGARAFGQTGGGGVSAPSEIVTTTIAGSRRFRSIGAGGWHSCGITVDGVTYCWGHDDHGQLGNGGALATDQTRPSLVDTSGVAGGGGFVLVTGGLSHSCALTGDGRAYCWGDDAKGQLGNGASLTGDQPTPTAVDVASLSGETTFRALDAGGNRTCGITASGVMYCWGDDEHGALGNGATSGVQASPSPVDVSTLTGSATFVSLDVGALHTCALASDGRGYCWGADNWGLGDGPSITGDADSPHALDTAVRFSAIASGMYHSCAVAADDSLFCWGSDLYGQVANGWSTQYPVSPSQIVWGTQYPVHQRFSQVAAGRWHTCGVTTVGYLYCWGQDHDGQVGNGGQIGLDSYDFPILVGSSLQ